MTSIRIELSMGKGRDKKVKGSNRTLSVLQALQVMQCIRLLLLQSMHVLLEYDLEKNDSLFVPI